MIGLQRLRLYLVLAALAIAPLVALAGCNTMEGLGEDISAGGEALQDAADDDDESKDY
jgi:predicted small secreted protein